MVQRARLKKQVSSRAKSGPGARERVDYKEEQDRDQEKHKDRTKPQELTSEENRKQRMTKDMGRQMEEQPPNKKRDN